MTLGAIGYGSDIDEAVAKNRVDLAISPNPVFAADVSSSFLFSEELRIICRRDHPVYGSAHVFTLKDMATAKLVAMDESLRRMTHLEYELREQQIERDILCTVTRMWSLPNLVANTDAVAVVGKGMADALSDRFSLKTFDLPIERPDQQWHIAWHGSNDSDPGHIWLREKFIELIRG